MERGLSSCLEHAWLDFRRADQVIQPVGKHTHTLVYLHGFTCSGYDYLAVPEMFYRPKKAKKARKAKGKSKKEEEEEEEEYEPHPGLRVVLPSGPTRRITAYDGEPNCAWYDYLTDHEGDAEDDFPPDELAEVTQRLHALLAREAATLGDGRRVFLGGCSQGCGVALHAGLTYEGELGGLLGTMGHVLSSTPVAEAWLAKKVPVHACCGLADSTMPWEKWVAPTWERLKTAGACMHTTLEEGVDHGDEEREAAWIRAFLAAVMRAKPTAKKEPKKKAGSKR